MNENIFLILLLIILLFCIFSLNKVFIYEDPLIYKLKKDLIKIDERVKYINFYASDSSFTEDKIRIYLCLKDVNGNYYNYNDLIYVSLHELAHAFSSTIDNNHTSDEFLNNFQYLINKGTELKIYDPTQPFIDGYCSK